MTRIALIGAGAIGRIHASNVSRSTTCSLAHVVDVDRGRADDTVDAVIVASSTDAHKGHVLAAARAGKAILCERPIADSLDDARRCVEEVDRAGVIAAMGFNRRLDAVHQDLHKRLAAGDIGKVEMLRLVSQQRDPAGAGDGGAFGRHDPREGRPFFDLACWLACWLAGSGPFEVGAMGDCLIDPRFADFGDVDTAIVTLRLQNGALATFDFGRRTTYGVDELIEVFGSDGLLLADRQPVPGAIQRAGARVSAPGLHRDWYQRFAPSYVDELAAIAEAAIVALAERRLVAVEPVWR